VYPQRDVPPHCLALRNTLGPKITVETVDFNHCPSRHLYLFDYLVSIYKLRSFTIHIFPREKIFNLIFTRLQCISTSYYYIACINHDAVLKMTLLTMW